MYMHCWGKESNRQSMSDVGDSNMLGAGARQDDSEEMSWGGR